jgi:hypothetical protein
MSTSAATAHAWRIRASDSGSWICGDREVEILPVAT